MYYEILQSIIQSALLYAVPFTSIEIKDISADDGLAVCIKDPGLNLETNNGVIRAGRTTLETHMDRGKIFELQAALSGRHGNQQLLLTALSNIHSGLSRMQEYPTGADWNILSIETLTAPSLIELEETEPPQWHYGSVIQVKFYVKGVET